MKRKCLLVYICMTLVFGASTGYGEVYAGNKYGCNVASQWGDEKIFFTESMMLGFIGGFWLQARLFKNLTLQSEALITFKGRKSDSSESTDLYLCYLEIPLLIKHSLIESFISVSAYSGFSFSLVLSGYMQPHNTRHYVTLSEELPVFDIGFIAGSDISMRINKLFVSFDLRLTAGVIPTLNNEKVRNIVFTPFLSYGMKLQ